MKTILILFAVFFAGNLYALDIERMEYFIDDDPGLGMANQINITPSSDIDVDYTIDLNGVSNGFHILYVRAGDELGNWGFKHTRTFLKDAIRDEPHIMHAEYYIDTDPGYGAGTDIPVTPGTATDRDFTADLSDVGDGFHFLVVRVQDNYGNWSYKHTRMFLKEQATDGPDIVAAEYYFSDGVSSTSPVRFEDFPPSQNIDITFVADLAGLKFGSTYTMHTTVADTEGVLSLEHLYKFTFVLEELAPPSDVTVSDVPDDNGHSVMLMWTISPADEFVTNYNIYRSRNPELTEPVDIESITTLDALIKTEQDSTILIASVQRGLNSFTDTFVPLNNETYYYWIQAVGQSGESEKIVARIVDSVTSVEDLPVAFRLSAPYPNPFNPATTIRFELPDASHVRFVIYDILGREVTVLEDRLMVAGVHEVVWNARNRYGEPVGSGMYLFRLEVGGHRFSGKVMFLR